jgi:hypothetical protein
MGAEKQVSRSISLLKTAKREHRYICVGPDYLKLHRKIASRALRRYGKYLCKCELTEARRGGRVNPNKGERAMNRKDCSGYADPEERCPRRSKDCICWKERHDPPAARKKLTYREAMEHTAARYKKTLEFLSIN